ncbi:U-box domain-containing protein 40-like [Andrographis paniculata]|uniref:U-box domain-containing protein 40-like n=1 Tax=Andrographis paniculata TaxID=175694 RepID=UPI0021E8AD92|nr:U-box domain-containing protein 40-like [Andrographis paniculata]
MVKKHRWKILFHKSSPPPPSSPIPAEFLCPLSGTIMADPVIVASGHTFERNCVLACVSLSFVPILPAGAAADFSAVIPNIALKSAILNWCRLQHVEPPKSIEFHSAEKIVRNLIHRFPATELERTVKPPADRSSCTPPTIRPSCYSSCSSCETEISSPNLSEEEEIVVKLENPQIHEQEEALNTLRRLTRTREETRLRLCTPRLLSSLKSLIASNHPSLQANAAAAVVNLSLEKQNKVKIVRSGIIPPLIDVLHGEFLESKDHAAGALFSLSLADENKTAIGVLGALQPLLHSLRSESVRTRNDAALALYHLSSVQINQAKLIKLGAVRNLLNMVKSGHMLSRAMLILRNLAANAEGRTAMLEGGAVKCFVALLSDGKLESPAGRDRCLAAVYWLSRGGLRFKALAKEAAAEEVLMKLEKTGSKVAGRILEALREKVEFDEKDEEEVNWVELLGLEEDGV